MHSVEYSKRILFVDDEPAVGRAFERTARALDYQVDVVTTPGEAVERAREFAYPVVVTDLRLRGVDGYAVIDALGSLHPATAFVIVTGQAPALAPCRLRGNAAISSLVSKPWDSDDLAIKLELAFRLHHRRLQALQTESAQEVSVLVVEDSPSDALLLRSYLERGSAVRVTTVSSLASAVIALHDQPFDVIFTDLTLPDARGVDTVFRLRSAGPSAAIVVCSGLDDQSLKLQLIQLGAHECISKAALDAPVVAAALITAKERKAFELRLAKLAYYDPLTGAANRAGWSERATYALARASRRLDRVALVLIDLDGFKRVNDSLGHDAGDALLQEVVTRLQHLVREYDIVARLGGDEFGVIFSDLGADVDVSDLGARIHMELAKPLALGNVTQAGIDASLGIAVFPENGETLSSLTKLADAAMYRAKEFGTNRAVIATGRSLPSSIP